MLKLKKYSQLARGPGLI